MKRYNEQLSFYTWHCKDSPCVVLSTKHHTQSVSQPHRLQDRQQNGPVGLRRPGETPQHFIHILRNEKQEQEEQEHIDVQKHIVMKIEIEHFSLVKQGEDSYALTKNNGTLFFRCNI